MPVKPTIATSQKAPSIFRSFQIWKVIDIVRRFQFLACYERMAMQEMKVICELGSGEEEGRVRQSNFVDDNAYLMQSRSMQ
jgi:hypothetical protein